MHAGRQPIGYLRLVAVRVVFTAYVLLIALGLAVYIAIGLTQT